MRLAVRDRIRPACGGLAAATLITTLVLGGCAAPPRWVDHHGPPRSVFPAEHWAKAVEPEDVGWSSATLRAARELSERIGSTAVMVVHRGVVVDAWGEITTKSNLHSVRKSLLSALIGTAVGEGRIDLTASLASLGIDDNPPSLTAAEKLATVGDLIRARSGVYHAALYETPAMTASKPPRGSHPPGTHWHYNNWDFNALGTIYEQQSGERIFESFERRIAAPLQMEDYTANDGRYVTGAASIHAAYPFRMTARDLARFALLFLREGRWRERQIVPAAWVVESTATHSRTGPEQGYGYMWWTGRGAGLFPNVRIPEHGYYAAGYRGQYAFVFPDHDLVVVHRVNTDFSTETPSSNQIGRVLWMILSAGGIPGIGPDPGVEAARGERLDGDGIRAALAGATGSGANHRGRPWRVTFGADGSMTGVAGWQDQHRDEGRWEVEDGRYCRRWNEWNGGRKVCRVLFKRGTEIEAYDETGTSIGRMTIVPP